MIAEEIKTILDRGREKGWMSRRGKPLCLEHRKKLSFAKMGKPRAGDPKKWKHSKETIEKFSASLRGRTVWNKGKPSPWTSARNRLLVGENSPVWKGGITHWRQKIYNSPEYKRWREVVFERDNYTCVWCGAKSGNGRTVVLNADHIKPFALFPELRFSIENGRTLCEDCHRKTESFGGRMHRKEVISKYLCQ